MPRVAVKRSSTVLGDCKGSNLRFAVFEHIGYTRSIGEETMVIYTRYGKKSNFI